MQCGCNAAVGAWDPEAVAEAAGANGVLGWGALPGWAGSSQMLFRFLEGAGASAASRPGGGGCARISAEMYLRGGKARRHGEPRASDLLRCLHSTLAAMMAA